LRPAREADLEEPHSPTASPVVNAAVKRLGNNANAAVVNRILTERIA
jgi:hypothetical protein